MDIAVTWQTILALAAGLITISGAVGVIAKVIKPIQVMRKDIDKNRELLERDNARLIREEANTAAILTALLAIVNHEIDGNHIDNMKAARNTLTERIIENGRK